MTALRSVSHKSVCNAQCAHHVTCFHVLVQVDPPDVHRRIHSAITSKHATVVFDLVPLCGTHPPSPLSHASIPSPTSLNHCEFYLIPKVVAVPFTLYHLLSSHPSWNIQQIGETAWIEQGSSRYVIVCRSPGSLSKLLSVGMPLPVLKAERVRSPVLGRLWLQCDASGVTGGLAAAGAPARDWYIMSAFVRDATVSLHVSLSLAWTASVNLLFLEYCE